jgi:hypothetical protein
MPVSDILQKTAIEKLKSRMELTAVDGQKPKTRAAQHKQLALRVTLLPPVRFDDMLEIVYV